VSVALLALIIGVVAGMRAMMAPAAASWAVTAHPLDPNSWLAIMGYRWTPWVFSLLSLGELVTDQLPSTPSRKVPQQFAARIVMGALSGATIGAIEGMAAAGAGLGIVGALIGTYGGAAARAWLAGRFGRDWPAALIEDAVAIGLSVWVVCAVTPAG
jgi:uncharacterized membrane protein